MNAAVPVVDWNKIKIDRRELLLSISNLGYSVAQDDRISDDEFHRFIRMAVDWGVVDVVQISVFGRKHATAAYRWLNGSATPDSFLQQAVIRQIAGHALKEAFNVTNQIAGPPSAADEGHISSD